MLKISKMLTNVPKTVKFYFVQHYHFQFVACRICSFLQAVNCNLFEMLTQKKSSKPNEKF